MSFGRDMAQAAAVAGRLKAQRVAVEGPRLPTDALAWCHRYLPFQVSDAWAAFIASLCGLPLEPALETVLREICGFTSPNPAGYAEAVVVAGRRGGKSAVTACLATYVAIVEGAQHMRFLAPGQRGYIVCISRTQPQATEVYRYARSIVERNPELMALLAEEPLESQSGGQLRFQSGIVLTVMAASKASVRGYTVIGAILDEFAWLATDEEAAHQDQEIAAAIRYAMSPPVGAPRRRLLMISSPAAKSGIVYDSYAKYFGKSAAPVLVARGATWVWNPNIDRKWLEDERARDPKIFTREVLAEFVDAVSAWCDAAVIDAAVVDRTAAPNKPIIIPTHWRATDGNGPDYFAACDIAFKRDASVLAIGHLDVAGATLKKHERRFIVDGIWKWTPRPGEPLEVRAVVDQISTICHEYGLSDIVGDQFAALPLAAEFSTRGIKFEELVATNQSKLEFFTKLREAFYAGRVSLPNDETAIRELKELQERITSSGSIQIGHPSRVSAHDDHASAVCWLYATVTRERPFVGTLQGDWMQAAMER